MNPLTILIIILVLLVLYFVYLYNKLVKQKVRCQEAESDIDVQLKRRNDLIPNLIETVKGYMGHERSVLENVTRARTELTKAKTTKEALEKDNILSATLKTLFAVAENYPDLKANANFLELQRELSDTEDKLMAARRFYNSNVRDFNTSLESFPTNMVSKIFKGQFTPFELFEIEAEAEKKLPQVKF